MRRPNRGWKSKVRQFPVWNIQAALALASAHQLRGDTVVDAIIPVELVVLCGAVTDRLFSSRCSWKPCLSDDTSSLSEASFSRCCCLLTGIFRAAPSPRAPTSTDRSCGSNRITDGPSASSSTPASPPSSRRRFWPRILRLRAPPDKLLQESFRRRPCRQRSFRSCRLESASRLSAGASRSSQDGFCRFRSRASSRPMRGTRWPEAGDAILPNDIQSILGAGRRRRPQQTPRLQTPAVSQAGLGEAGRRRRASD